MDIEYLAETAPEIAEKPNPRGDKAGLGTAEEAEPAAAEREQTGRPPEEIAVLAAPAGEMLDVEAESPILPAPEKHEES